jgi:hypothetical protein
VEVPEKYLKQHSNGASDYSVADSLIRDGYDKLRTVAVLRHLFRLSLQEANQVYEETGKGKIDES